MTTASLISDRSRELARKTGGLRHTPAVGLDAAVTTKILQWFFRWSSFLLCSIYAVAPRTTHAYKLMQNNCYIACADLHREKKKLKELAIYATLDNIQKNCYTSITDGEKLKNSFIFPSLTTV